MMNKGRTFSNSFEMQFFRICALKKEDSSEIKTACTVLTKRMIEQELIKPVKSALSLR